MYFHVVRNCQRDGRPVYIHTKTYRSFKRLMRHLESDGRPAWIIESKHDYLPTLGNFTTSYWNTGGFGFTTMPVLPLERR